MLGRACSYGVGLWLDVVALGLRAIADTIAPEDPWSGGYCRCCQTRGCPRDTT